MVTQFDRDMLKEIIAEILQENPSLLKGLVKEVIDEEIAKAKEGREIRITNMIHDDFNRFDTVFKDLA
jgi:hypothetical protein